MVSEAPPVPAPYQAVYALPSGDQQAPGIGAIFNILRRNAAVIVAIVVVVVGAVLLYSRWITPVYELTTSIAVDEKRSSLPDIYESVSPQENAVSTEMQMLQSRSLMSDIVRDFGLQVDMTEPKRVSRTAVLTNITAADNLLPASYTLRRQSDGRFQIQDRETKRVVGVATPGIPAMVPGVSFTVAPLGDRISRISFSVIGRERATESFAHVLKVDRPVRDANLVSVTYRGNDPILIKDVLNALATRFIDTRQNVEKAEARSAVQFLREQRDTLSSELAKSDEALRDFRERKGAIRLDEEANNEISRMVTTQADRNSLEVERSALAALLRSVDADGNAQNSARYRQLVASPSLLKNPAMAELLQSQTTLENQLAERRVRYTEKDPQVQAMKANIRSVDNQIHSLARTYLNGLNQQAGALDRVLTNYHKQLQDVPQKDVEYTRLDRNIKVLNDAFMLVQTKLKEAEIAQSIEDPSVRVVDPATVPSKPLRPNLPANLALGFVLGLLLGVGTALARHFMDRSIHTRADVIRAAGLPVIGLIPSLDEVHRMAKKVKTESTLFPRSVRSILSSPAEPAISDTMSDGIISDAYARLEANISQLAGVRGARILLVTSAVAGEGKTMSAVHLARTVAKHGRRVLLIDADLRNSGMKRALGEDATVGLGDVLAGTVVWDKVVRRIEEDEITLSYISAGTPRKDPAALLRSPKLGALLDELGQNFDVVVLDTPPLILPDAVVLSPVVDGVIVLARSGQTDRAKLGYAVQQLRVVEAPVLGVVINDVDFERDSSYDGAFGYYGAAYAYGDSSPQALVTV